MGVNVPRRITKIGELTRKLEGLVRDRVPVETGQLLSEVASFVDDANDRISGKVKVLAKGWPDPDWGKAGALEYGAHRPFTVKAHQMKLDHFWSRAAAPQMAMVQAFTRTPNIAEHDFLRGPLAEIQSEVVAGIKQAVASSIDG